MKTVIEMAREAGGMVDHMVTIPYPMTKDCQYTLSQLGQQDPKCFNCNWRQS